MLCVLVVGPRKQYSVVAPHRAAVSSKVRSRLQYQGRKYRQPKLSKTRDSGSLEYGRHLDVNGGMVTKSIDLQGVVRRAYSVQEMYVNPVSLHRR